MKGWLEGGDEGVMAPLSDSPGVLVVPGTLKLSIGITVPDPVEGTTGEAVGEDSTEREKEGVCSETVMKTELDGAELPQVLASPPLELEILGG